MFNSHKYVLHFLSFNLNKNYIKTVNSFWELNIQSV